MKRNSKIALCAISAALSTVFMITSYFPYLTYAIPAIAGLFMMVPLVEINPLWSVASYIVSALLVLMIAEPEAAILYLVFFGYYPILKALIERIGKLIIEWILKFAVLNIAIFTAYLILSFVMDISIDDFGEFGKYGAYIFVAACNGVFVLYDIAISQVSMLYMLRIHPRIKKMLK